jgi:hypothetical protein
VCGPELWDSIVCVATKQNTKPDLTDCDPGVVLMGFQDGSLRASIVYRQIARDGAITLKSSRVTTLLEGSDQAPFLCLQMIIPPSSCDDTNPLLVCTRENGSITVLSSIFIHQQSIMCESRVISMSVAGSEFSSSDVALIFLGAYDNGRSFYRRVSFRVDRESISNSKQKQFRLQLHFSHSVVTPSVYYHTNSSIAECLFAVSQCYGNVILFKIHSDALKHSMLHELDSSHNHTKSSILVRLLSNNDTVSMKKITTATDELPTHESLLHKLKQSTSKTPANRSKPSTTLEAIREIRNATRVSSYVMSNFAKCDKTPWTLDGCKLTINSSAFTGHDISNWDFVFHVIMCPLRTIPSPCCYRLAQRKGSAYTKVNYGGVVQSIANKHLSDNQNIQIPAFKSATSVCGSLQMKYVHGANNDWHLAKTFIKSPVNSAVAIASRCPSLVHFIPISESVLNQKKNTKSVIDLS